MTTILLFDCPGIYVPLILDDASIEWWRHDDQDEYGRPSEPPLCGVQVDSADNGRKFATVRTLRIPQQPFEE